MYIPVVYTCIYSYMYMYMYQWMLHTTRGEGELVFMQLNVHVCTDLFHAHYSTEKGR